VGAGVGSGVVIMGGEVGPFVGASVGEEVGKAVDRHVHGTGPVGLTVGGGEGGLVGGAVGSLVSLFVGGGVGKFVGWGVTCWVGEGVFFARFLLWLLPVVFIPCSSPLINLRMKRPSSVLVLQVQSSRSVAEQRPVLSEQ